MLALLLIKSDLAEDDFFESRASASIKSASDGENESICVFRDCAGERSAAHTEEVSISNSCDVEVTDRDGVNVVNPWLAGKHVSASTSADLNIMVLWKQKDLYCISMKKNPFRLYDG